jgi:hypothetical protein
MKNKLSYITIGLLLLIVSSCQKDPTGNPITVEASTNTPIAYFNIYESCMPGPNSLPLGSFDNLNDLGGGNYDYQLEEGYEELCYTITGNILANSDSTGTTMVSIKAFYTEEGNVVGFQDIEMKRPHGEYKIKYEFRADTYLE